MSTSSTGPDEIEVQYERFMNAVDQAENAATPRERSKWIRTAREAHETLSAHDNALSSAQRRRLKRAYEFLQELANRS